MLSASLHHCDSARDVSAPRYQSGTSRRMGALAHYDTLIAARNELLFAARFPKVLHFQYLSSPAQPQATLKSFDKS